MTNILGFQLDSRGFSINPNVSIKRQKIGDVYLCSCYAGPFDWHIWYEDVRGTECGSKNHGNLAADLRGAGFSRSLA